MRMAVLVEALASVAGDDVDDAVDRVNGDGKYNIAAVPTQVSRLQQRVDHQRSRRVISRQGESIVVRAGIEYLVGTQDDDGGWTEEPFTGTGFPRVFYLKYHLYPVYFPLMAIGRYLNATTSQHSTCESHETDSVYQITNNQ